MKYQRLRGMKDVYGAESLYWQEIVRCAHETLSDYGCTLIMTPIIEQTDLFIRSVGEKSDIVMKEMYNFLDKKGREIVLRPEGTAPVVRAYLENSLPERSSLYYVGPMYRYERPQKGRYREFYQIGVERFGGNTAFDDADMIMMAADLISDLGIQNYKLKINNIGVSEEFNEKLGSYLGTVKDSLCEDCKNKMERAPIRVLDCKKDSCISVLKDAPKTTDYLNDENKKQFSELVAILNSHRAEYSKKIEYEIDSNMVRGLDYYTGTVFEFTTDVLGPQQNTILAGGRYNNLVKELGGKDVPATGFALGIERMVEVMKAEETLSGESELDFYIVSSENTTLNAYEIQDMLRMEGFRVSMHYETKSFKAQMKEADKLKARYALLLGDDELKNNTLTLKNMETGNQSDITIVEIIENSEEYKKG